MAGSTGLEPAASGVTGRRSNQLNYDPNGAITQIGELGNSVNWCNCNSPTHQFSKITTARRQLWWAVQDSNL